MVARLRISAVTLAVAFVSGCLSPTESAPINHYLVTARAQVAEAQTLPLSLGVRELEAARPYHLSIARLEPDGRLDYYNQSTWGDYPAAVVTRALRDAIVQSKRFADTGMAEQMARPDLMLVGYLNGYHEDRTTTPAKGVVEVRLELREARGTGLLWAATLREEEPISGTGAAALTAAMNAALERLVTKAATEITAVEVAP